MRLQCFLKPRSRSERALRVGWQKSRWVRYILDQQQIQQMNCDNEDNGSMLFFKLKHLFFDQNLEQEQIASLIRENPLPAIDKILVKTTSFYNQRVEQIVETLEDEKQHLVNQLVEIKQKLQHSLQDNEVFKSIIDRLEEINKDVEIRLNQSETEMERTHQECQLISGANVKFKYEVQELFEQNQSIQAENSQLHHTIQQLEKEIETHKHSIQLLNNEYNSLFLINREKDIQNTLLEEEVSQLKEESQNLAYKLHTKEQFIASFINQYNKIHFFQHHDSYNQTEKKLSDIRDRSHSHELKGFTFNMFEKESALLDKKSKQDISVELEDIEIDSKFTHISATAEKPKNLTSRAKLCESEQKSDENPLFKVHPKQFINPNSLKKSLGVKFDRLFQRQNESGIMSDSVSFKNIIMNNSNTFPSETEGSKIILEETLRKKISDKESRIKRLQSELYSIKTQYIQQRQKLTQVQGEYQIRIEQLRDENLKLKTQVSGLYQKYVLAHSQGQIYLEKSRELQEILQEKQQEHAIYCRQLRDKCKEYVIKRIDEVEHYYQQIVSSPIHNPTPSQTDNPVHHAEESQEEEEEEQSEVDDQSSRKSVSLKLESAEEAMEEDKNIQISDTYSYRQLSTHHVNSLRLNLNFSTKENMISSIAAVDEVYIKDTFEIESDLGAFTQRLKYQTADHRQKGHLTARDHRMPVSQNNLNRDFRHLSFVPQTTNVKVTPLPKALSLRILESITVQPSVQLIIAPKAQSAQKYLTLRQKTVHFTYYIQRQKNLKITNCQASDCLIIPNTSIQSSLSFKSKETNKKYSISSFCIFQSASTLNTTFRQTRSESNNHCESFLIHTEDKNQDKNATFILQEQGSRSQVRISSFGINPLLSESRQKEIQCSSQLQEKQLKQGLKGNRSVMRSSSKPQLNHNQYIKEDSCYEIMPDNVLNSQITYREDEQQVASSLMLKKEVNDSSAQDSQQIKLKSIREEEDQLISSHCIAGPNLNSESYPCLIKQPFFEPKHPQFNHHFKSACTQDFDTIPHQLQTIISSRTSTLLSKFLKRHKLTIAVESFSKQSTINYQQISKRKLILLQSTSDNQNKTFILTHKRLFCLEDETSIKADRVKYLPQNNLMIGQSQILLTKDNRLRISRESKLNRLKGDVPDGLWSIQLSVLCKYHVLL